MEIDIIQMYYDLKDDNDEVKKAAYQDYKKIRGVPADTWIAQLHDEDPENRAMAVCALGVTRRKETIEQLLAALNDDNPLVRKSAAWALGFMGNQIAVEPLISALGDEIWDVRSEAIQSLSCLSSIETGIWELIKEAYLRALKDSSPIVRSHATSVLRWIYDSCDSIPEETLKAFNDIASEVRCRAVRSLSGNFGLPLRNYYISIIEKNDYPDKDMRIEIIHSLEDLRAEESDAIDALIIALHDPDPEIRSAAAETLNTVRGIRASQALSEVINDNDPRVQKCAIETIGYIGGDGVYEKLIAYLDSAEAEIRVGAARGLLGLEDKRALCHMVCIFNEDPDPKVRRAALATICNFDDENMLKYLSIGLKDKASIVREYASDKIDCTDDEEAIDSIVVLLDDYDAKVRANAAYALGNIAEFAGSSDDGFDEENPSETELKIRKQLDEKATGPLIYALDDIEDLVRGWALDALINIGSERSVEHLVTLSKEGNRDAETALCDLKHPSMIEPMMKLYESEDVIDRSRAVKMLGNYDNPELTEIFLSATTDSSPLVRVEAVTAITDREDQRIDDALCILIQDPDEWIRMNTIHALSHRASKEAVDRLIIALDDTDNMVRETAAKALVDMPTPDAEKALLDRFNNDRPEIVSSACEFFIRKGIPESEQVFINAMKQYGWRCADSLAYSGNPLLETAARDYLREYYFPSVPYEHEDTPKWGSDRKE